MNSKILLLIPILLFLVPSLSYAEIGKNFDRIELEPNIFQWTSHYERIFDGSQWVNYIWFEDLDIIKFESASLSYEFNKNDCSFSLFEPLTNNIAIEKYERTLSIDGSEVVLSKCEVQDIELLEDGLKIITIQNGPGSELKTLFNINAIGSEEWTYEITNNELFTSKIFSINEVCLDCKVIKTTGDFIDLGFYILDTKNSVHNYLKTKEETKDFKLTYEMEPKGFFEKGIIDPVFSTDNPTLDAYVQDDQNNDICDSAPTTVNTLGTVDVILPVGMTINAAAFDCRESFFEFPISTIPNSANIINTVFKYEIETQDGSGANCDYYELGNINTLIASPKWIWSAIMNNNGSTALVSNDSGCNSTGNNKSLDLGTTADSRITSMLVNDRFVIGVRGTGNVGAATDGVNRANWFASENDNDPTPKPTLEVTYNFPAPLQTAQTVNIINVGDIANITGIIYINNSTFANLTSIKLFVNGTLTNTNGTNQNKTTAYAFDQVRYGPLWYQMTTNDLYNFTIQATAKNTTITQSNITKSYLTREYTPNYLTAIDPVQGTVNYTFPGSQIIKVNRDKGGNTFSIECAYITQSNAFFNNTDLLTWDNETVTGYYKNNYQGFYYVTCYNDGELFTTILNQNYSNYLVPGMVIFDELGGFAGAPSVILVIIAILSLATGRNFPIIIIIAISVTGILGALQLVTFDVSIWGALIVIAGITVFGVRKFY